MNYFLILFLCVFVISPYNLFSETLKELLDKGGEITNFHGSYVITKPNGEKETVSFGKEALIGTPWEQYIEKPDNFTLPENIVIDYTKINPYEFRDSAGAIIPMIFLEFPPFYSSSDNYYYVNGRKWLIKDFNVFLGKKSEDKNKAIICLLHTNNTDKKIIENIELELKKYNMTISRSIILDDNQWEIFGKNHKQIKSRAMEIYKKSKERPTEEDSNSNE